MFNFACSFEKFDCSSVCQQDDDHRGEGDNDDDDDSEDNDGDEYRLRTIPPANNTGYVLQFSFFSQIKQELVVLQGSFLQSSSLFSVQSLMQTSNAVCCLVSNIVNPT